MAHNIFSQRDRCIRSLGRYIEKLYSEAEEQEDILKFGKVEMGITEIQMLFNCLNAQEIKEPLDDVIVFFGMPEHDTPIYHILVRPEDRERMQKDPYVHFMLQKKFTGVMEQDNKPKKKLIEKDGKFYCAECSSRIYKKYRPHHCRNCGTLIDWSGEWWYEEVGKDATEL